MPRSERPMGEPAHLVPAVRYSSEAEAEMWAELLRGEGVPCVIVPLMPNVRLGSFALIPHELRVRETDIQRARAALGLDEPDA